MCTIAFVVRPSAHVPLVVAANRDELLARPALPPFIWSGAPALLAPRDEMAGGTWLGLNAHALFVGVTNRAGAPRDDRLRSRGALVVDALRARSAAALHARMADVDPRAYNPFHLLYADRESAHLAWSDGQSMRLSDLAPGVHVVTERSFGAKDDLRSPFVRARLAEIDPSLPPDDLARMLARHAADPFAATCVHADAFGYGTRSSMILTLGDRWDTTEMRWAEGRPCITPFEDLRAKIGDLAALAPPA